MNPSLKKLAVIISLFVVSIAVTMPAFAFDNEPEGFRGIEWGTNISELSDMFLEHDQGDSKIYSRKGDKLKIGDADIDLIGYKFYKGRLYGILIGYRGASNFRKLKTTFFDLYGQGKQQNEFMDKYHWWGATVIIILSYSAIGEDGYISYTFKPIYEEETKDDEQKAKKGADDL